MAVNGGNRIMMFFMFFFLATTIALAVYLIFDKITERDTTLSQESRAVLKFPGYFRTKEEQQVIEKEIFQAIAKENSTRADDSPNTQYSTCSFNCGLVNPARKRRSANFIQRDYHPVNEKSRLHKRQIVDNSTDSRSNPVYHGCCISRHFFVSPATLPNIKGEIRTIVQFNDRRQYFLTQECRHAQSCTGCQCTQENTLVNAVVENPEYPDDSEDEFVLEMLRIGGCCKCFNTQRD